VCRVAAVEFTPAFQSRVSRYQCSSRSDDAAPHLQSNPWLVVKTNNKQLKEEYKQRPLTLGVFLIRNTVSNRIFLASGQNLTGIINRHKFDLRHGSHKNKELQADWNESGAANFAFEIVEQIEPPTEGHFDVKQELRFMEDMWLAELKPFGERGYNQPKLSRAERLRRIASKRSD